MSESSVFRAEALSSVLRISDSSDNSNNNRANDLLGNPSVELRFTEDLEELQLEGQNSQNSKFNPETEEDGNLLRRRTDPLPYLRNSRTRPQATGMTRRCVCNLGQCASQNYMCKSERRVAEDGTELDAGCFVEETTSSESVTESGTNNNNSNGRPQSAARRGCIEMLSREKQKLCSDRSGEPVQCCFNEDMCNYPKTYYPPVSSFNPNANSHLNRLSFDPAGGFRNVQQPNFDQQIWLRAAVIAVPICGLMILIVLILVARKLLRPDDDVKECHPKSTQAHQLSKAHFLEPQEFLLPPDPHCYVCHNSSSLSGGSSPSLQHTPTPRSLPSNSTPETEELVSPPPSVHTHHCPCSLDRSFSTIRPPAIMLRPQQHQPKKFSLLQTLGLRKVKDSNTSYLRPYNV